MLNRDDHLHRQRGPKLGGRNQPLSVGGDYAGRDLYKAERDLIIINNHYHPTPPLVNPKLRQSLINKVRARWIEGVLKPSLTEPILLQFMNKPDLVGSGHLPSNRVYQVNGDSKSVILDKSLNELYEINREALLILGEPGSGKTMTMLQLCDILLDVAERDDDAKVPVVFNLATWTNDNQTLSNWLLEEADTYQISRTFMGGGLIKHEQIILCLDGLDEIAESEREGCVQAINRFRQLFDIPIVVCSRIEEFNALEQTLNLSGALIIQPLTDAQIDEYLSAYGEELSGLKARLPHDPELTALARIPIFLTLMPIVYECVSSDRFTSHGEDQIRADLLDRFIEKVFVQKPLAGRGYTVELALGWLEQIAFNLSQTGQQIFYIEFIDDRWVPTQPANKSKLFLTRFFYSFTYLMIIGIVGSLIIVNVLGFGSYAYFDSLIIWLGFGLLYALIVGSGFGLVHGVLRYAGRSDLTGGFQLGWVGWPRFKQLIIKGVTTGLIVGGISELILWSMFNNSLGLFDSMFGSTFIGDLYNQIRLPFWLKDSIGLGTVGGLLGVANSFLTQRDIDMQLSPKPNASIYRIGRVFSIHLLVYSVIGTALLQTGEGLSDNLFQWWYLGFMFGFPFGLVFALLFGGGFVVPQHYSLRWFLMRQGILPFGWPWRDRNLVSYLDEMRDRALLKRVGSGWIFYHRYLLEHLVNRFETKY